MDVAAPRTNVANPGGGRPIEIEKRGGAGVELCLAFCKFVVTADQAFQNLALDFDADGIGFEKAHSEMLRFL